MKLLKFKQEVCAPCKSTDLFVSLVIQKEVDETHTLFAGDKTANDLAEKYDVMQTPSFVLTDAWGEKIDIVRGSNNEKIIKIFEKRYPN